MPSTTATSRTSAVRVWPGILASCNSSSVPVRGPLSAFAESDEVHEVGRVIGVPLHAGSFQAKRQVLAHGFRWARADVPAPGQSLWILHHLPALHEVAPQSTQALFFGWRAYLLAQLLDGRQHRTPTDMLDLVKLLLRPRPGLRSVAQTALGRCPDVLAEVEEVQQHRVQLLEVLENLVANPGPAVSQRQRLQGLLQGDRVGMPTEQDPEGLVVACGGEGVHARFALVVEQTDLHFLEAIVASRTRLGQRAGVSHPRTTALLTANHLLLAAFVFFLLGDDSDHDAVGAYVDARRLTESRRRFRRRPSGFQDAAFPDTRRLAALRLGDLTKSFLAHPQPGEGAKVVRPLGEVLDDAHRATQLQRPRRHPARFEAHHGIDRILTSAPLRPEITAHQLDLAAHRQDVNAVLTLVAQRRLLRQRRIRRWKKSRLAGTIPRRSWPEGRPRSSPSSPQETHPETRTRWPQSIARPAPALPHPTPSRTLPETAPSSDPSRHPCPFHSPIKPRTVTMIGFSHACDPRASKVGRERFGLTKRNGHTPGWPEKSAPSLTKTPLALRQKGLGADRRRVIRPYAKGLTRHPCCPGISHLRGRIRLAGLVREPTVV